ncbi:MULTISPECIES: phage tail tube protein [unclassified Bradyrhizobium]|uniref:phage tail tube protein n=1 Tax=unclassified Bradyrhizobium TaxID=2631580 RepID=UPI0028F156BD|nr:MULTISPECIES: phage tail tube protein [unclassified Bradyrhizobium]
MHTSGGRVSIVINGVTYSARGVIKIAKSNQTNASGVNQDGTLYRTVQPKARTAECTFDRFVRTTDNKPLVWDEAILQMTDMQITFTETDGGQQHIMSGAFWVGDPQEDTSTGEIEGLSIAADACKTINL